MKVLREVTEDWKLDFLPNHTYLLDGEKIIAYKPWHDDPIQKLSGNMKLDRRRRKFKELEFIASDWDINDEKVLGNIIRVNGSKGNTYEVDTEAKTCSCPGFSFRGSCKHVTEFC